MSHRTRHRARPGEPGLGGSRHDRSRSHSDRRPSRHRGSQAGRHRYGWLPARCRGASSPPFRHRPDTHARERCRLRTGLGPPARQSQDRLRRRDRRQPGDRGERHGRRPGRHRDPPRDHRPPGRRRRSAHDSRPAGAGTNGSFVNAPSTTRLWNRSRTCSTSRWTTSSRSPSTPSATPSPSAATLWRRPCPTCRWWSRARTGST